MRIKGNLKLIKIKKKKIRRLKKDGDTLDKSYFYPDIRLDDIRMKCVAIRFYGDSDILLKHSGSRDQTHNNLSSQIKLRNKGIF